jgi:ATP/maltotriose-dependent transcriptional regulator MalT
MNKALTAHNEQIQAANGQMKEANRIKDEYIGRFLELSSNLIKRGEERSKQLNRLARDRKLEELYAELKSSQFINSGIRMFHQNFDEAFLNIYPDFIIEVNKLLLPNESFAFNEGESKRLTTELRILALIRLGISDNQEIADILRSSITTIYTYRSKLKARAVNKDSFEDDVRKIATY